MPSSSFAFGHGYENIGLEKFFGSVKASGSDADDCIGLFVNADRFADDFGIGVEQAFPCGPGNDGGFGCAGVSVIGALEKTSKERAYAENFKVLAADFVTPNLARGAVGFQAEAADRISGNGGKNGIHVAHIANFGIGKKDAAILVGGLEGHHAFGVRNVDGAQH